MGMSASQARFLALTARKSNVEFEGQQINQQRTTLSNESANYYSELCNMNVPTPPSVDDYTKVSYTFNDGALTNTITSMIAKGNNNYSISYIQQWQDDYSIVSASSSLIAKSTSPTGATTYSVGTSVLRELGTISDGTATYDATALAALSETDFNTLKTNTSGNIKTDAYLSTLTQEQLVALMKEEEYYKTMVNEKNQTATDTAWYVRYVKDSSSGSYVPYFYQKSLVDNPAKYTDGYATSNINCYSIGSETKTKEILNQLGSVEKDSTGRYISITIYETDSATGEKKTDGTETTYTLTTNTSTDEDSYNDAMNQYNYDQNQYDKKVQDINSKLEIIQEQDKNLELNLKQLDTEENAIPTEMDAVKKVISKNVESSFKTFNA